MFLKVRACPHPPIRPLALPLLLTYDVRQECKTLTHQHIMREVWGGSTDVQYLRIYVRQLRQKIEADPERPTLIQTEAGVGYRLRRDD